MSHLASSCLTCLAKSQVPWHGPVCMSGGAEMWSEESIGRFFGLAVVVEAALQLAVPALGGTCAGTGVDCSNCTVCTVLAAVDATSLPTRFAPSAARLNS